MAYLTLDVALMEDFIVTIREDLACLESRMRTMEVLLKRLMNDERNNNILLDIVSKEELSENICDVEYLLDVFKPEMRRKNEHLIDYMLILARNIKKKRGFLKTVMC
ncbi:unnamed protein product [Lactuca virosa]|uniref:Uncharacterized protein n=1 Tax=Lactuca virosa TaxID=75947 RepID=A0AAU9PRC4_9ASTR|nr:unnamed protein product [Lactuca virosa]